LTVAYPVARHRLGNGLRVVASEDHATPAVTVHLHYCVGSQHEAPGQTGLAHLFEHLMSEGSAHVGPGEHAALMHECGAVFNAATGADQTVYHEHLPAGALELAFWLEADRMATLAEGLSPELLNVQRAVVRQEKHQTIDSVPFGNVRDRMLALVYPSGHPYHHPVIGFPADLDQVTVEDAAQFFATWYAPGNAVLAVTGDITPERAFAAAEKYFGPVPAGPQPAQPHPRVFGPAAFPARDDAAEQVPFGMTALGWRLPPNSVTDPEIFACDMALRILAGGKPSRAHQVLVRGMQAAQQATAVTEPRTGGNSLGVVAVPAMPGVGTAVIEKTLTAELDTLACDGPEDAELACAKAAAERELLAALSGSAGRAGCLADFTAAFDDPAAINSYPGRIRGITPDQVRQAAATWLRPESAAIVTTRPALRLAGPSPEE
jgi:zinc protease